MIQDRSNLAQQLYQAWTFESDFHNKHCPTSRDRTLVTIRSSASPDVSMHANGPLWNINRALFVYCVETSLVLQTIALITVWNNSDSVPASADYKTLISLAVCQMMQALVLGAVLKHTFHMIVHGIPSMKRIGQTYLTVIIAFAGFHLFAFTVRPSSYHIMANVKIDHLTLCQCVIGIIYYSVATISSTGFGDVYAWDWPGMTLAAIQMCLGTLYNIGIFAILCSHFQNVFDVRELQLRRQYAREHRNLVQRLFKQMRTHIPGLECGRKFLIRHLVAFVISTTLLSLAIIKVVIGEQAHLKTATSRTTLYVLALLGLIQAIVIISTSVRVVKKIHVNFIDFWFLLQSVMSTVVIFGHFYVLLSLFQGPDAFHVSSWPEGQPVSLERRAFTLLFFSTVVQTTTGYGDVWALSESARVLVTMHMLISTLYAVAVVGLGISRIMMFNHEDSRSGDLLRPSYGGVEDTSDQYQTLVDHHSELLV